MTGAAGRGRALTPSDRAQGAGGSDLSVPRERGRPPRARRPAESERRAERNERESGLAFFRRAARARAYARPSSGRQLTATLLARGCVGDSVLGPREAFNQIRPRPQGGQGATPAAAPHPGNTSPPSGRRRRVRAHGRARHSAASSESRRSASAAAAVALAACSRCRARPVR